MVAGLFAGGLVVFLVILALAPKDNYWIETKKALEARGEALDWEKFIPSKVPAEENFFEDPVAASLVPIKGSPVPGNPLKVGSPCLPPRTEDLGVPFAMARLSKLPRRGGNSEKEVTLEGLRDWFSQWDESLTRMREAGKRTSMRMPGNFSNPAESPIANFVMVRSLAQALASRARVHLLLGSPEAAFDDLETMWVLMKVLDANPGTLVTAMIRVAVTGLYLETIEEGLQRNLWTDPELSGLVSRLQQLNLIETMEQGIRAERAAVLRHLDALARRRRDALHQSTLAMIGSGEWTVEKAIIRFTPPSWIRRNQAQFATILQGYLDGMDPITRRIDVAQIDRVTSEVNAIALRKSIRDTILLYVVPNFSKAVNTMSQSQSRAHRLMLSCALERFRLRNDAYPAALTELIPHFISSIPIDIDTGGPLQYRQTEPGFEILGSNSDAPNRAGLSSRLLNRND